MSTNKMANRLKQDNTSTVGPKDGPRYETIFLRGDTIVAV